MEYGERFCRSLRLGNSKLLYKIAQVGCVGVTKASTDQFLQSLGISTVTFTEIRSHDTGNHQGTEDNESLLREDQGGA